MGNEFSWFAVALIVAYIGGCLLGGVERAWNQADRIECLKTAPLPQAQPSEEK